MLQSGEAFFTVIGCMDGRCQEAVALFGQERFGAKYPDTITEAGFVGLCAQEDIDEGLLAGLKKKIDISLKNHHSKGILVYGHAECAASDAVDDTHHKEDVLKAAEFVRSFVDSSIPVIPLFVSRSEENDLFDWEAKEIMPHHEDHSN